MLDFLAMFPGQGSQSPAMSLELLQNFEEARLVFEEAEDLSQISLKKICTDPDEADKLSLTTYQQPALLTHSYAVWLVLRKELGLTHCFYAGHSLGEYTALAASGKLSFKDALFLVCQRAKAMEEAVPAGLGGMLAVRARDFELLSKLCFELQDISGRVLEIVNYNSPEQFILSGHSDAIDEMALTLKENKVLAKKLSVSGPFHSSLMKPAREVLAKEIKKVHFFENEEKIIPNVLGALRGSYDENYLISQMDNPVLWKDTLESAWTNGCEAFVEFGPGKVLSSLVKKNLPKASFVFDTKDIVSSLKVLEKGLLTEEFPISEKKDHFSKTVPN